MEAIPGKVLVFLPTYNEAGNIGALLDSILELPLRAEVLVVDDRSPDGTGRIVASRAAADGRIHLKDRDPPRGRGLAGRDGFRWFQDHPRFDVVVEMDADFSHHPRFIPGLIEGLAGNDVVIGSRFVAGGKETGRTPMRRVTSSLANAYLRFILQTPVRDCTSGFRVFSRRALEGIDFSRYRSVGPTIVTELLFDLIDRRMRIAERPIHFEDRVWGDSKLSIGILARSLFFPLKLRWERCLRKKRPEKIRSSFR